MKPVLFASTRPLDRAENIRAVFDAYDGYKDFVQTDGLRRHQAIRSGWYDLMVIDEFPTESPGKIIMIGHGINGGKTVGLDQPHPYFHPEQASLITRKVVSGTAMIKICAHNSNIDESRVLPLGMARTDQYIGKKKGDGQTVLAEKRSWLYVPTFRCVEETPLPEIDWEWLDQQLGDDELIAVKAHMMTGNLRFGTYRHIIQIPSNAPSAPYLYDCDGVITDYSSILFDGYLLGKPCILFEKQKGYLQTRGMYLQYPDQYSSRYCTNEQDLLALMRSSKGLNQTEKACLKVTADMCDGHACERICRLIHEIGESA